MFVKLISRFTFVLVSNPRIPCYICPLCLLRVVTCCYIFIREKVCQTSFQVRFCISFQPTDNLLYMFIGLVKIRYALLPFVTSWDEKHFVIPISRFTFVLVSNPRIPCYICSLGLLRVVTCCCIYGGEKVCQTSFQVHFCISFHPTNNLLYMFTGLVKSGYALLPFVTSSDEKNFVKLVSWFTFVLVSNHRILCYICSLGLFSVVSRCYIFRRENVCQTNFQVNFCISFQPTNTLLYMFIGLVKCCYLLLHL